MASVWLRLTPNNVREGGRERDPLTIGFNLNREQAAFFPEHHFTVRTEDGFYLVMLASGHGGKDAGANEQHAKNLRSIPDRAVGDWLCGRLGLGKDALIGSEVQFSEADNGLYFARYRAREGAR